MFWFFVCLFFANLSKCWWFQTEPFTRLVEFMKHYKQNQLDFFSHYLMHHAVPQGWCVIQREHIVENPLDLLGYFQTLLRTQFIHSKSCRTFYCAFYKDILPFQNPDTALKNKINNWTKWQIFTWYPRVQFMSSSPKLYFGYKGHFIPYMYVYYADL